jgi:hypothetical protein
MRRKTPLIAVALLLTVGLASSRGQSTKPTVTYGWIEPTCAYTSDAASPSFREVINNPGCLARTFKVTALPNNHISGIYVDVTFWYPESKDDEVYHWTAMTLTADPDGSFAVLFPGGPSQTILSVTVTELLAGESTRTTVTDPTSTDHP